MAVPLIQIWTRSAFHPAFKCGGWAWVRVTGAERMGQAGGERNTQGPRMALAGLMAACKDLPNGPLSVDLGDPELFRLARRFTDGTPVLGDDAPAHDLDLWAQFSTALQGRVVTFHLRGPYQQHRPGSHGGPAPFAQAWADLAMDKAKASGAFAAMIPKPNLAKLDLG